MALKRDHSELAASNEVITYLTQTQNCHYFTNAILTPCSNSSWKRRERHIRFKLRNLFVYSISKNSIALPHFVQNECNYTSSTHEPSEKMYLEIIKKEFTCVKTGIKIMQF
jgi:hypothetical protein